MTEQTKKELKEKHDNSGLNSDMKTLSSGAWIKNAPRTGDGDAAVGTCWKDFWQIFSGQDFPTKCPFCGEELEATDIDGCHIKIAGHTVGKAALSWSAKKYIIPGHHKCNTSIDGECQAKITIVAVEAIEK